MLSPNTFAFTALLALLTALGPLAMDLYLPSLPAIEKHREFLCKALNLLPE